MPRLKKKSSIGNKTRKSEIMRLRREARSCEEQLQQNSGNREYIAQLRLEELQEQRNNRLQAAVLQSRRMRQNVTDGNRQQNRERMQMQRTLNKSSLIRIAFGYDPKIDYSANSKIMIGKMDKECGYCHALMFKNEAAGMCCASGKVVLPKLNPPPEPFKTLIGGMTRKRGVAVTGYPGIFSTNTLSRLYTVHLKQRECFFLRLLLINVRGPISYKYLRTINGKLYDTYHDACRELQLLEGDNHWEVTIADAALSSSPYQIRHLFAILLTTCFPHNPNELWEKFKDPMSEDILYRHKITNQDLDLQFTHTQQKMLYITKRCVKRIRLVY